MRSRTRKEVADFVMEAIRSFGAHVHPASRIAQMHRLTSESVGTIYPGDSRFEVLLEADRDFQMLEFIFEHLENAQSNSEFCKLLQTLSSDSTLPQMDRLNSVGRNSQFHLFTSAMCLAGGMKPVTYAEPDVVCTLESQRIGLAAKRIKSGKQAAKHIRKAISQIGDSSLPGVVVLDSTIALNPENAPLSVPTDDEAYMDLHATYVNWFLTKLESRIRRWATQANVLGLVVHDKQLRLNREGDWELSGMTIHMPTANSAVDRKMFDSFFESYTSGLPNLTRF